MRIVMKWVEVFIVEIWVGKIILIDSISQEKGGSKGDHCLKFLLFMSFQRERSDYMAIEIFKYECAIVYIKSLSCY